MDPELIKHLENIQKAHALTPVKEGGELASEFRARYTPEEHEASRKAFSDEMERYNTEVVSKEPIDCPFELALKEDGKIADFAYASDLYCVLNNNGVYDLNGENITSYGMRSCAGMIAALRGTGSYLNFYCNFTNDDLQYIHDDLERLGYRIGEFQL